MISSLGDQAMITLIFAALAVAAHASVETTTRPIERLIAVDTIKNPADPKSHLLKIKFHSGGCSRSDIKVTYDVKLKQSKLRDIAPELKAQGSIGRVVDAEYEVTALVTEPKGRHCMMAFDVEDTVDLNELARKQGAMDFKQPDTAFDMSFELTNKVAASASIHNWAIK
jgi:hypothetical protein